MDYLYKYCAFIDILGFKNMIKANFSNAVEYYESYLSDFEDEEELQIRARRFINERLNTEKETFSEDTEFVFSDSIIIYSCDGEGLLFKIATIGSALLEHGYLFRGGIGYGRYYEKSSSHKIQMVSEGLVEAVDLESSIAKYPRIIISQNALKHILDCGNHLKELKNLLIQAEDNYWSINPFYLSPKPDFIALHINKSIKRYAQEPFLNKYEWLGELVNYMYYWGIDFKNPADYFLKTKINEKEKAKIICNTSHTDSLGIKFFHPRFYDDNEINSLFIYKQTFENNVKWVKTIHNKKGDLTE